MSNQNPFRVRDLSHEYEIMPKKEESKFQQLKMNIPKGILKTSDGH